MPDVKRQVKFLRRNATGRDFIVGDLHGCYDALVKGLSDAQFRPLRDRVISVGDLIDRGPDSLKCIGLLDQPWFYAIRGNHEQMMIDAVIGESDSAAGDWMRNGGVWALELSETEREALAKRLDELPYAFVVGEGRYRYNVVHAEFFGRNKDLDQAAMDGLNDVQIDSMLWGREICRKGGFEDSSEQAGLATTYCGHSIVDVPFRRGSHVFLDTGAYLNQRDLHAGHKLTLLVHGSNPELCLPERAVVDIESPEFC